MQPRFDRGYTGHEMLCGFGLINMNGRVYDPYVQRFLSADNVIQSPDDAQSYNRYSYCLNNPLKYTDPTGWNAAPFDGTDGGSSGGGLGRFKGENLDLELAALGGDPYASIGRGGIIAGSQGYVYVGGGSYQDIATGKIVPYSTVYSNYVVPNSENYRIANDQDFRDLNITIVSAFGKNTVLTSDGPIGDLIIGTNGAIRFSNNTAGINLPWNAQGGGGNDWENTAFDLTEKTLGGTSLVIGGVKTIAKEFVRQVAINNRLAGIKKAVLPNAYNVSKSFGTKLGIAGGLVTVGGVLYNSEVNASDGINMFMTGIAFTGWGAPVAGLWLVADVGTGWVTGTSLSKRIDSSVGGPLVDWEY